jgi:hypothetical protein
MDAPVPFDLSLLAPKYRMTAYQVHSNTAISSRTAAILRLLFPNDDNTTTVQDISRERNYVAGQQEANPSKSLPASAEPPAQSLPPLVTLTAQAKTANKLISIVEIVKREARKVNPSNKVFQYTELTSKMIEIPREPPARDKPKTALGDKTASDRDDGSPNEEDEAFETMPEPQQAGSIMKLRRVPVLTIYLAAVSVRELKVAFG